MRRFLLGLILILGLPALGDPLHVYGNNSNQSVTLNGSEQAQIMGNNNTLDATGTSTDATISLIGNKNHVTSKGKGGTIDIVGNQNHVTVDGNWETVNMLGNQNTVIIIRVKDRPEPSISRVGKDCIVKYEAR